MALMNYKGMSLSGLKKQMFQCVERIIYFMENQLKMKKVFTVFLFLIFGLSLKAQYAWEFGSFIGVSSYLGDLSTSPVPTVNNSNFGFGICSRYAFNYQWSIRSGIYVSNLKGDDFSSGDSWRETTRRAEFTTRISEVSVIAELEPFGKERYLGGRGFKKLISPYFFAGLGVTIIKPKPDFTDSKGSDSYKTKILMDQNAQYSNMRFTIPMGVGVKFDLSELWNIGLELGARTPFTDYLDGVSEAGNPDRKDWYFFSGITVFHRMKESMKR
jgi:hypothetical protein